MLLSVVDLDGEGQGLDKKSASLTTEVASRHVGSTLCFTVYFLIPLLHILPIYLFPLYNPAALVFPLEAS